MALTLSDYYYFFALRVQTISIINPTKLREPNIVQLMHKFGVGYRNQIVKNHANYMVGIIWHKNSLLASLKGLKNGSAFKPCQFVCLSNFRYKTFAGLVCVYNVGPKEKL